MKTVIISILFCFLAGLLVAGEKDSNTTSLTLEVEPEGSIIELEWTIPEEIDVDFFTIERTGDLHDIQRVALLFGPEPGSGKSTFQYADRVAYGHSVYYRVRHTLINGESLETEWVKAEW